jgi:hypothetical protein
MDSGVRTRHLKAKILAQLHPTTVGGYEKLDRKDSLTRGLYNNITVRGNSTGPSVVGCVPCNGFTPTASCDVVGGCIQQFCDRHQF